MTGLHHLRRGGGEPLLLIHGIGSHGGVWDPVAEFLVPHHDVDAVDLPGFGRSESMRRARYHVDGLADAVVAHLDELGWDRPYVAGNSLGGLISLELARRGRARAVVAISPGGAARGWEYTLARAQLGAMRIGAKLLAPVADQVAGSSAGRMLLAGTVMARPHRADPQWLAEATRNFASGEGFEQVARQFDFGRALARFTQIEVPVRIAWGSRDTVLLPRQAERFAALIPDCELVVLPGLGHTPMSDDPERVAEAILEVTVPEAVHHA